jgi:hypothetical protein
MVVVVGATAGNGRKDGVSRWYVRFWIDRFSSFSSSSSPPPPPSYSDCLQLKWVTKESGGTFWFPYTAAAAAAAAAAVLATAVMATTATASSRRVP